MKFITARCRTCGESRTFRGESAEDLLRKIDATGWRDAADEVAAYCSDDCAEIGGGDDSEE